MEIQIDPAAKALIFDCDGTLVDTMRQHRASMEELLNEMGLYYPGDETMTRYAGMPIQLIIEELNKHYSFNLNVKEFAELKDKRAGEMIAEHSQPIESVVKIVHDHYGRLPMAVASGGILNNVLIALRIAGIEDKFNTILSADDPVEHKPHPGIFLEAARRLGIMPQYCQVFEDGEPGIIAAQAAGMIVTDVRPYL